MHKLREQGKHFSSLHTNCVNYDTFLALHSHFPSTIILNDLNKTRISSRHNLVRSSLRLKRAVTMYFGQYQLPQLSSEEDWEFCREVEAVLNILKDVSTLVQNEKGLYAAYGPVMRMELHKKLNSDTMEIIDVNNWGKTPKAPRVTVDVATWSDKGKECKQRALLECERKFFGNRSEDVIRGASEIKLKDREKAALVLDKRTCANTNVLSKRAWQDACNALKEFYISFYTTAMAYKRMKKSGTTVQEQQQEEKEDEKPTADNDDFAELFESFDAENEDNLVSETDMRRHDTRRGGLEYEKVIKNWTRYRVPWKNSTKRLREIQNVILSKA